MIWKYTWNGVTALGLLILSTLVFIGDINYPGEIMFHSSHSLGWLNSLMIAWFGVALFFAVHPKRFVIPIGLLTMMRGAYGFPLNLILDNNTACQIISGLLVLISLIYCVVVGFKWINIKDRSWFRGKHSLIMVLSAVSLGILWIPLALGGMISGTQNLIGDYTRFSLKSISMVERVFQKDGRKIYLIGMMHIGDQTFYQEVNQRMEEDLDGKRVILTEGVRDENNVLPEDFKSGKTYAKWAKKLGLKVQGEEKVSVPSDNEEFTPKTSSNPKIEYINADIDISELSEEHQGYLQEMLNTLNADSIFELFAGPQLTGEQTEDLMIDGLIKFRNDRLMEHIEEASQNQIDEIYVPWGAAHLPDIEDRLHLKGFEKISEEKRPVVRFWKQ